MVSVVVEAEAGAEAEAEFKVEAEEAGAECNADPISVGDSVWNDAPMRTAAANSRMKAQLAPQHWRHEFVPGTTKLLSMLCLARRLPFRRVSTGARSRRAPELGGATADLWAGSTKLVHLGHAAVRAIFLTHVPTQTVPHGKIINLSLQAKKKQHKRPFEIMSSLWRYPARQGCFLTRSCPICDCSRRKVGYHTRVGSAVWATNQARSVDPLWLPKAYIVTSTSCVAWG